MPLKPKFYLKGIIRAWWDRMHILGELRLWESDPVFKRKIFSEAEK